jgi:hypothetical protein
MVGTMPLAFAVPPLWGFSAADAPAASEDGVANTHGIMRSRYEGSFSPTPSRRFVRLIPLPIGGYFS